MYRRDDGYDHDRDDDDDDDDDDDSNNVMVMWIRNQISFNTMKVGQHRYSTLNSRQEQLELSMVFNPESGFRTHHLISQNLSQDYQFEKGHQFVSKLEICRLQKNT